jgi:hypothetical protein
MFVVPQASVLTERLIDAARKGITIFGKVDIQQQTAAVTR